MKHSEALNILLEKIQYLPPTIQTAIIGAAKNAITKMVLSKVTPFTRDLIREKKQAILEAKSELRSAKYNLNHAIQAILSETEL